MKVSRILFPWCHPQGMQLGVVESIFQSRRLPQLTLSGLPETPSRRLKQKLDILIYEFLGTMRGRFHLHFMTYRDQTLLSEVELACLLSMIAAENGWDTAHCAAIGEVQLDGTLTLSSATSRTLSEEIERRPESFRSMKLISPQPFTCQEQWTLQRMDKSTLLQEATRHLATPPPLSPPTTERPIPTALSQWWEHLPVSQRRLAQILSTGWHSSLLIGPPGCGKSHFAHGLISYLTEIELRENPERPAPPFAQPSTASTPEHLTFGYKGRNISSAWDECPRGVFWLDEIAEFKPKALESLRVPLDGRTVRHPRLVIGTCNPCPCGYAHHPTHLCGCAHREKSRYGAQISGPLLDRISIGWSPAFHYDYPENDCASLETSFATVLQARKTLQSWSEEFVLGAQWISPLTLLPLFHQHFPEARTQLSKISTSRRRQLQLMRRLLTLRALDSSASFPQLLREALAWDCQHIVHFYWGTAPALSVSWENLGVEPPSVAPA